MIFIVKDKPNEEDDIKLAEFVLNRHASESRNSLWGGDLFSHDQNIDDKSDGDYNNDENIDLKNDSEQSGGNTGNNLQAIIPMPILKKYIRFARLNVHPKLTREAINEIKKFYVDIRAENKKRDIEGGDYAIPIVARSLEGFVRLSEAYAKMELSNYVTADHAKEALKLAQRSIEDTTRDPNTGELNYNRIFSGVTSAKKKLFKILDLLLFVHVFPCEFPSPLGLGRRFPCNLIYITFSPEF